MRARSDFQIDESVVSSAAAMYQEQVLSYKHLDEPLDEGRFVFECILAGYIRYPSLLPVILRVDLSSFMFKTHRTVYSAFVWLK